MLIDGEQYNRAVPIAEGRKFTSIHHVYLDRLIEDNVSFAVYKGGEFWGKEKARTQTYAGD